MSKFKIGDRVRNLATNGFVKKGICGVVMEDNCEIPYVKWDNGGTTARMEEYLELIEKSGGKEIKGNFKAKCIKNNIGTTTLGKVYKVINGKFTYDDGQESNYVFNDINDLNKELYSKFELVKDNPIIVIYTKGNETIATLKQGKEVIKTAKAKCNPSDEFNFEIGAKLAFERLIGNDKNEVKIAIDTDRFASALKNLTESFAKAFGNLANKPSIKVVKQDEYEVGDRIKFVSVRPLHWNDEGKMDKFLGKIVDITEINGTSFHFKDDEHWSYLFGDIEGKVIEDTAPLFDWDGFKQGKFAVHCDTEEKANEFLKECDVQGIKWISGNKASNKNLYESYKEETCYCCFDKDGKLQYCLKRFYEISGLKIFEYIAKEPYKEVNRPAKVGEWIKILSDRYGMFCHSRKIGDIFLIDGKEEIPDKQGFIWGSGIGVPDYVVLENYHPTTDKPVEQPFKKAKVGDKIKIVKSGHEHDPIVSIGDVQEVNRVDGISVGTKQRNWFYDKNQEYIIIEEPKPDNTINVGDMVEVVDRGKCYSTYAKWFDKFAPQYASKFKYGESVKDGFIGKVVAKHEHVDLSDMLYAIQREDREIYLIGEKGIKKIHQ